MEKEMLITQQILTVANFLLQNRNRRLILKQICHFQQLLALLLNYMFQIYLSLFFCKMVYSVEVSFCASTMFGNESIFFYVYSISPFLFLDFFIHFKRKTLFETPLNKCFK